MALFTPTNQKRLTNVSIVKFLAKTEKRRYKFEIACFPNKVVAWRQKLESNLNEVLQSDLIYFNVSKAEIASKESLIESFKTFDKVAVAKIILEKGELQLTEKERQLQSENLARDISKIVAGKTLNPTTKSCFTPGVIEKMLKDCHINLKPNKSAKQQSLDVIRVLKKKSDIPIDLALFSVSIVVNQKNLKAVKKELLTFSESLATETTTESDTTIEAVFEPGNYEQFKESCGVKCTMEVTKIMEVVDEHHRPEEPELGDVSGQKNDSDNESKDSEPQVAAARKPRRRAKNKSGGDVTASTPTPVVADEGSSDEDDGNNHRRRGKKKGAKK